MVPNGWEVKSLSSITKWSSGGTPSKNNPDYWNGEIPWISAASMRGHYFEKSELRITDLAVGNGAKMAPKDSLLLLVRGSMLWNKIPVGITAKKVSFNQDVKCLVPHADELTTEFLLYWFLTYEHRLMNMVTGTGIGAGKLDTSDLQSLDVFLPPLPEQRKIAQILSTWDRGIATTEKLIDASKQQKKALMQQLLTGKKRLGCAEGTYTFKKTRYGSIPTDWAYPAIKDIAVQKSEKNNEGLDLPVLSCSKYDGFVDSLKYFKKKVYSDDTSGYRIISKGCFGFPANHIEEGSIGLQNLYEKGIVSPIYVVFQAKKDLVENRYLYALLKTDHYRQIFSAATNASVDRRGSLRWKEFSAIHVSLPPLEEQKAIADVLELADKETKLLEAKLAHLKQEKKALMQQLLTGKRRVKVNEVA
ncbi:restriction endonuclease subunit S [Vibrio aestuarianus subsp. cardii]|uniref:restriction endonuclease subunit S n=1 Tax=Vibrio aestuarianus TaxID=28171 RepID=UPI0015589E33|nr:restriction endonuclease subunit S [Vibrio aestuarianus]NGZ68839.1 restriction endonuclease subunit S [Vibrio aestuarianus subsp. cardii]